MNCVRIARLVTQAFVCALPILPLTAADSPQLDQQLVREFQKTNPSVSQIHVLAESPLLVAVSGPKDWAQGELLGVFARSGDQLLQISMLPNDDFPTAIRIEQQTPDSITLGLGTSDNLKIFFDPTTYFPKRIVHFAPVEVRRITTLAGVLTLTASDGKQDFTARERNGAWRVTSAPAAALPPPPAPSRAR